VKTAGSSLIADITRRVQTLATIVTITRLDGTTYRITNHDADITVGGFVYQHNVPFNMSAIRTSSSLAVDNNELTLKCDGTTFILSEFEGGAFDKAGVEIALVDYLYPAHGLLNLRRGYFGEIAKNKTGIVNITIVGLLKVLDFEVGRVYQPTCDADLGDRRCKVAIDLSQSYDPDNPYKNGEWVYDYKPAGMTEITLTNPGFEADGVRASNQAITGWTRSPDSSWRVAATAEMTAYAGTYSLFGGNSLQTSPYEEYLYQDVDLVAAGIDDGEIDNGEITFVLHGKVGQSDSLEDEPRFLIEVYDTDGDIIDRQDTGYFSLDAFDAWRGRHLVFPLLEGARTARIYLYSIKRGSNVVNTAFDEIKAYWYNHLDGNPYEDVIHKVLRCVSPDDTRLVVPFTNGSFENQGAVANSGTNAITGWTRPANTDFWAVSSSLGGIGGPDLTYLVHGGDDGSGVQKTYTLYQQKDLQDDFGFTASEIATGRIAVYLQGASVFGDTGSAGKVEVTTYNASNTLLSTHVIQDWISDAGAPSESTFEGSLTLPTTARYIRTTLYARSPTGSSNAQVGFDGLFYSIADTVQAQITDLAQGEPGGVPLDPTIGSLTWDGELLWRAHSAHVYYDQVASVVSRKEFNGTTITGGDGTYTTAVIKWITGNNRGQKNIVRVWDDGTKKIKLYFPSTNAIQVGDRYQYVRSCQKRFTEDCQAVFSNTINFRGFPYLPGKIT
jgi:hypothetical protein